MGPEQLLIDVPGAVGSAYGSKQQANATRRAAATQSAAIREASEARSRATSNALDWEKESAYDEGTRQDAADIYNFGSDQHDRLDTWNSVGDREYNTRQKYLSEAMTKERENEGSVNQANYLRNMLGYGQPMNRTDTFSRPGDVRQTALVAREAPVIKERVDPRDPWKVRRT